MYKYFKKLCQILICYCFKTHTKITDILWFNKNRCICMTHTLVLSKQFVKFKHVLALKMHAKYSSHYQQQKYETVSS